ncbi:MAG: hypothetical protein A3C58_01900 [Candidatus Staskawiczbacteria bacterium RIFCSPHIGHO2_02_FULL_34_10]|uniref:ABC transporter ATP-binding protein n=2 Tax=Candidatus Staskawicziibacteriota TaxID=1817916 RepID=A0A1G2HJ80_9BACT|nr:MAG: hypothetical protein A2639_02535 [Candidatus Staskawiczbacteria bacterium RIFCSPHIGHO2_01_FULL_34_27]OGZ67491.1 MAG: hypothetical protein A3C58_01900 [Candidatus Staskawiczbacteria bacterium RIFCSPHIGHO2_02_FULL_34_10]
MEKQQKNIIYPKVGFWDISKAFWQGIRLQKWSLFFLLFLVVLINIVSVIIPLFYKQFFDVITLNQDKDIIAQSLIGIIIKIAIFHGVIWLLYRLYAFCNSNFQANTMARLKQQAYDYLMKHSYGFFTNNFTGSLVQKVNRFARSFERIADKVFWDMLSLAIRVIAIIAIVYFINTLVALVILIWAIIFIVFNVLFSIWKIKYDLKVAEIDSKSTAYLADTITNQNTVSLFSKFNFESKGYKNITNQQASITKFNWNLSAFIEAVQALLGFAIEFLLFYFTIKYWKQGLVTVGFFVLLQAYLIKMMDDLWGFTRMIRDVYSAYADAKEMVEIMKLPHEITDAPIAKELKVKDGKIQFSRLQFSFNKTRKVLKNINLVINPGEKVAIIGPSGAGKTTFVKLLLRLYSPTSGQILIDSQDIQMITQDSLRKNISLVPQDPILFHRTLAENIGYGKPDALKREIEKVAKLAHCDEFIKNLSFGLETFVGERGIKLSGGERQRVAIARAILKNAPILILDEATSSLDSHSEMLIQDALNTLMAGKTTIVIAHRLSTIQKMDRIIVIDNGKIIEQGSHSELLSNENSLYKKLWSLQAGGFLTESSEDEEDKKEGEY